MESSICLSLSFRLCLPSKVGRRALEAQQPGPGVSPSCATRGSYKYGVRHWLDVLWCPDQPEAWFYEAGYLHFASRPYTEDLSVPTAHITNLSPPHDAKGQAPWSWSSDMYDHYLQSTFKGGPREHIYREQLLPAMKAATASTLATVRPAAASSSSTGSVKWKRFGIDFMVDANLQVWMIEFNHNPGMASPKGSRGDLKRVLVNQFVADEQDLRRSRSTCASGPYVEAVVTQRGDTAQDADTISSQWLCGFARLSVPTWRGT
ncbi:unnamed protein product [Prorocentrum cordatum]|uniref:Tubulin--tyrosine ligase-like protein 9 n=2 Tax=Prorocentrum cordatum TaxID=2364126 RepID=A0ABN9RE41_9DINO|nr:unnamed protein product [Polarella glacialis]